VCVCGERERERASERARKKARENLLLGACLAFQEEAAPYLPAKSHPIETQNVSKETQKRPRMRQKRPRMFQKRPIDHAKRSVSKRPTLKGDLQMCSKKRKK
jgi:hypothetical protein